MFVTWVGDHAPTHVHVLRDGRLLGKWNLEMGRLIEGRLPARVVGWIRELQREGRL